MFTFTLQPAGKEKAKSWPRQTKEALRGRVGDASGVLYTALVEIVIGMMRIVSF